MYVYGDTVHMCIEIRNKIKNYKIYLSTYCCINSNIKHEDSLMFDKRIFFFLDITYLIT